MKSDTALLCGFCLWTGGTVWVSSPLFVDPEVAAKWFWALWGAAGWIGVLGFLRLRGKTGIPLRPMEAARCMAGWAFSMAIYVLLQMSGLCNGRNGFTAIGTFDNPAGLSSLLALSLPFFVYLMERETSRMFRLAASIGLCGTLAALAGSGSRAGMAAALACGFLYGLWRLHGKWRAVWIAGCLIGSMMAGSVLYRYKKDSADGRILIWRCTWEMIAEHPVTGYGHGGFTARYMDFQARHFRQHPDCPYRLLADNVTHPFCEYLHLWTDYGLPALLLLLLGFFWAIRRFRRYPDAESRCAMLCLCSLAVFALFSYPLRYPHTWLWGGTAVWMLFRSKPERYRIQGKQALHAEETENRPASFFNRLCHIHRFPTFQIRYLLYISVALCLAVLIGRRMEAEIRWCHVARQAMAGDTIRAFPQYERLKKQLGRQPLFLYNYAAELNVAGRYAGSLSIAREGLALYADYDLHLLQADNHTRLGQYAPAIRHLRQAARMCPGRLRPHHKLLDLYIRSGNRQEACQKAREILHRPAKIESEKTWRMRQDAEQYLQSTQKERKQD